MAYADRGGLERTGGTIAGSAKPHGILASRPIYPPSGVWEMPAIARQAANVVAIIFGLTAAIAASLLFALDR